MSQQKKNTLAIVFITISVFLLLATAGLVYWNLSQREALNELVEQMTIEKAELEDEYEDLAIQFDGFRNMDIKNDSLQDLLTREQQRVQDLLEELRVTKATNARRIAELKKELATVRTVMKDYVRQIDSLNATNARLEAENIKLSTNNQQLAISNQELVRNNSELSETVSRAAMLQVITCDVAALNKNDRKTSLVRNIKKLQFSFVIAKNITCEPGMKNLYARIMTPQGELLGEDETKMFAFESGEIPYTLVQPIEYGGETYEGVCYYALADNEKIEEGFYTIDFFCNGDLIGSFPFSLK